MTTSEPVLHREDLIPDARLEEADQDAFRHLPIAGRLAELASSIETPANIALFGPWGSGKSSFYALLRGELGRIDPTIRLVRYDAWKYGGGSLKRNFISSAAIELGFEKPTGGIKGNLDKNRKWHRGLYENTKTFEFSSQRLFRDGRWKNYVAVLAAVLVLVTIAVWATATVMWLLDMKRNLVSEIGNLAPSFFGAVTGTLIAIGFGVELLRGATAEIDSARPSEDEQFADLFQDLIQAAKDQGGASKTSRLVFFIDELDRCSKADVVATLTSLRTFLDQPDCVFIVAADREVLEEALTAVEQPTPIREEEPYYSSASAFLDKIFQHQFSLPPLRGGRLTGFGRELVATRGGLWEELALDGTLDRVLYVLIPSHVRAPRRVKVLLNNFATNVRVSESRDIDWKARAAEIAKLTVYETEFPRLAADLPSVPDLPSLLLGKKATTERQKAALRRHSLGAKPTSEDDADQEPAVATVAAAVEGGEGTESPDPLLVPNGKGAELRHRQREDLRIYLESRRETAPDPGRDLLFLEAAGDMVGLNDPELSRVLEDESPVRPLIAIEAAHAASPSDRVAAARLVGSMSEREFGVERANMITVVAGLLEGLTPTDVAEPGDLVSNVVSYRASGGQLRDEQLPGLLVLALAAGNEGARLANEILKNPKLVESPDRLPGLIPLLDVVEDPNAKAIEEAVVAAAASRPEILCDAVSTLSEPALERLVQTSVGALGETIVAAAEEEPELFTEAQLDELVERILLSFEGRASERLDLEIAVAGDLLTGHLGEAYEPVRRRAERFRDASADPAARLALAAVPLSSPDDASLWANLIAGAQNPLPTAGIDQALEAIVTDLPEVDKEAQEQTIDLVKALVSAPSDGSAGNSALTETVAQINRSWWQTKEACSTTILAWKIANALLPADPARSGEVTSALERAIAGVPPTQSWTSDIANRLVRIVRAGDLGAAQTAEAALVASTGLTEPLRTQFRLIVAANAQGLGGVVPGDLTGPSILGHFGAGAEQHIARLWLALGPGVQDAGAVLVNVRGSDDRFLTALRGYGESRSKSDALGLLLELYDAELPIDAPGALVPAVNIDHLLDALAGRLRAATANPQRERVEKVVARLDLSGTDRTARRKVANMALELIEKSTAKAPIEVAAKLTVSASVGQHGRKAALKEAVVAADKAGNVNSTARRAFQKAGVLDPPKKRRFLGFDIG
jgi:hypothetical protein